MGLGSGGGGGEWKGVEGWILKPKWKNWVGYSMFKWLP